MNKKVLIAILAIVLVIAVVLVALATISCTGDKNEENAVNTTESESENKEELKNDDEAKKEDEKQEDETKKDSEKQETENKKEEGEKKVMYNSGKHHATMVVKNYGTIKLELDADTAPITVANFAKLVNQGFYNGLTFHRIMKGFMIQGGDPEGTGMGGSDENIKGEFKVNGVENNISHKRGVISMARAGYSYDSASSQFFIVHEDSTFLDGQYAGFGKVTEGMDVVDKIAKDAKPTDDNGTIPAANQPVIEKITMED